MSDQDPPDGSPSEPSALDDVWERLRRLEDVSPPTSPGETDRRSTAAAPRVPAPTPDAGATPATDGGRFFVPAPSATPSPGSSRGAPSAPAGAPGASAGVPGASAGVPSPSRPSGPSADERARRRYAEAAATPSPRPTPPSGPATEPAAPQRRPRRRNPFLPKAKWFRPKLRWIFLYLPLLVLLLLGGVVFWGWNAFNDLYRVELGDALTAPTGEAVNYLIVGSDTRDGIDAETPNVGAIGTGTEVTGRRSDTIIVLRVEGGTAKMMSIPRDLWVGNVATGKQGRINATYAQGPDNLVRSVTANLHIPINRYVEVDFVSFAGMVDAVGGIEIEFPHPVMDVNSGLKIGTAGTHELDGAAALAYVRSRHYTEEIDGKPVLEPTADIGRQARQQNFIRTVLRTIGETRNPLTLARVGSAAAKGVRVDSEVGFMDLVNLARDLGNADPETRVLPTENARKGGAAVLVLRDTEALPVLVEFGAQF